MAVNFSTMSGTTYPAWLQTFQAPLGQPILHGWKLFKRPGERHGCELFKHLWRSLPSMAVSFSRISGTSYSAWLWQPILHGCKLFKHLWDSLPWMSVSFSSIFGTEYPVWL